MSMIQKSVELDIDTKNAAHNLTIDSHVYSYNLVRSLGKNFDFGFELYHVPERNLSDLNYVAKYSWNKHTVYGDYSSAMKSYGISYLLQLSRRFTLGTEFTYNTQKRETKSTFAYRKRFKGSEVKGWINSTGKLSTLFTLGQFPKDMVRLKLYCGADIANDKYNVGYGVFVGQDM